MQIQPFLKALQIFDPHVRVAGEENFMDLLILLSNSNIYPKYSSMYGRWSNDYCCGLVTSIYFQETDNVIIHGTP